MPIQLQAQQTNKAEKRSKITDTVDRDIFNKTAKSLFNLGIMNPTKTSKSLLKKVSNEENSFQDQFEQDSSSTSNATLSKKAIKGLNLKSGWHGQGEGGEEDGSGKQTIKEYKAAYSQSLLDSNLEQKAKAQKTLRMIETKMKQEGASSEELRDFQSQVKLSARAEIKELIKDGFLKMVTSPHKSIEWSLAEKGLKELMSFTFDNNELYGRMSQRAENAREEISMNLRAGVLDALECELIKGVVSESGSDEKQIQHLLKVAKRLGVDVNKFVKNWGEKRFDLGLNPPTVNVNPDGSGSEQQKKQNQERSEEDEKEMALIQEKGELFDRARLIYVERFFKGDLKTTFSTAFSLRKVNRQLEDLGVSSQELEDIKVQARQVAKMKIVAEIKEAYLEDVVIGPDEGAKATYIIRKGNRLIKRAKKIGLELSKEDLLQLRISAEDTVYSNAVEHLAVCRMQNRIEPSKGNESEINRLVKMVKRIEMKRNRRKRVNDNKLSKGKYYQSIFERMGGFRMIEKRI